MQIPVGAFHTPFCPAVFGHAIACKIHMASGNPTQSDARTASVGADRCHHDCFHQHHISMMTPRKMDDTETEDASQPSKFGGKLI